MKSTLTQTGMKELELAIDKFPSDQRTALRATSRAAAERILARMRELLLAQTHGEGNTARALRITEDAKTQEFIIEFGPIEDRPERLPLWIELGTIHQAARPFARPAADIERERVRTDLERASSDAAADTFRD